MNILNKLILLSLLATSMQTWAQETTSLPAITPCKLQIKTTSASLTADAQQVRFNYKLFQPECSLALETDADWLFTEIHEESITITVEENTTPSNRKAGIRIGAQPPIYLFINQDPFATSSNIPTPSQNPTQTTQTTASAPAGATPSP